RREIGAIGLVAQQRMHGGTNRHVSARDDADENAGDFYDCGWQGQVLSRLEQCLQRQCNAKASRGNNLNEVVMVAMSAGCRADASREKPKTGKQPESADGVDRCFAIIGLRLRGRLDVGYAHCTSDDYCDANAWRRAECDRVALNDIQPGL